MTADTPRPADRPRGWAFAIGYWWLVVVSMLFVGWGLAMAVAPDNPLLKDWNAGVATTFYDGAEPPAAAAFRRFVMGVYGSAIVGFYLMQLGVVVFALRRGQAWAWWTIAGATGLAIALEIVLSLVHNASFNIWFNDVPPIVMLAIPLALTARAAWPRHLSESSNLPGDGLDRGVARP